MRMSLIRDVRRVHKYDWADFTQPEPWPTKPLGLRTDYMKTFSAAFTHCPLVYRIDRNNLVNLICSNITTLKVHDNNSSKCLFSIFRERSAMTSSSTFLDRTLVIFISLSGKIQPAPPSAYSKFCLVPRMSRAKSHSPSSASINRFTLNARISFGNTILSSSTPTPFFET